MRCLNAIFCVAETWLNNSVLDSDYLVVIVSQIQRQSGAGNSILVPKANSYGSPHCCTGFDTIVL